MKKLFLTAIVLLLSVNFFAVQAQNCDAPAAPNVNWSGCNKSDASLPNANLTGANLADANLTGANLARANLTAANLAGANLTNAGLPEAILPGALLMSATLTGANLVYANLSAANLEGANLTNASLQYATLPGAVLTGATLTDVKLIYANLSGANLTGVNLTGVTLINAGLSNANLSSAKLTGANLIGVNLSNANLSNANLTGANLTAANLTGATLTGVVSGGITGNPALPTGWALVNGYLVGPGANLTGANLTNANLTGKNLTNAILTNAILTGTNLTNANLNGATLTGVVSGGITGTPSTLPAEWMLFYGNLLGPGANLSGVNLSGVIVNNPNLTNANLTNAILVGTELYGGNLSGADLSGANLSLSNFFGVNLTGANLSSANLSAFLAVGITGTPPPALPAGWALVMGHLIGPGANTYYANLSGADLTNFNLSGAILWNANLTGTNLTGANLANAFLGGANLSDATLTGVVSGGITGTPSALPAGWALVNGYLIGNFTITFDANGGTTSIPATKSVTSNTTYGTLATTSRSCYTFNGWFTASSGGTKITSSSTVAINSDQTLYAQWTAKNQPTASITGNTSFCAGQNTILSANATSGGGSVKAIAAGSIHSLILKNDGTVWLTGSNGNAEFGYGTSTPIQLSGLSGFTAIAAGLYHSLFLKNDGTVWATGNNDYGQLGDGTTQQRTTLVQVLELSGITAIAAGTFHSLFLKNDGTVWATGFNADGQLGDGTIQQRTTPVQVSGLSGITSFAAGRHSLFLKNDGTVWATGNNLFGQLGDGTFEQRNSPVQMSGLNGITAVAAGTFHSLFLKNDGRVWATGLNDYGQLGDGTTTDKSTPVQLSSLSGITAFAAGSFYSLFLKNDGTVWLTGSNGIGQLGDGSTTDKSTPVQSGLNGITALSGGDNHSLFLKNDGTALATGYNGNGQLGDGTTSFSYSTPVSVIGFDVTITSHQWKLNGSEIAGASNATYAATAAGDYTVVVTNSNGCSVTSESVNVTVNAPSTAPSAITSSNATATSPSSMFMLSVNGGSLGTDASWKWYTASCGGTLIATGAHIVVTQSANTTYFVRADGACNTTACASITINMAATCGDGRYAEQVISFNQKKAINETAVVSGRSDKIKALCAPQNNDTENFVSLGFGGDITLKFGKAIRNGEGNDIRVYESTFGNKSCTAYPEKARVFASQDGCRFVFLGEICQDGTVDLGALTWAQYVRIVDVSSKTAVYQSSGTPDGYDVDAVEALNGFETNPVLDPIAGGASEVVLMSYLPGKCRGGANISADRTDKNKALGVPQGTNVVNFVSLGFGGKITLRFKYAVENNPTGLDLQVVETSYGNPSCNSYPEKARFEGSLDGTSWTDLGELCLDGKLEMGTLPYLHLLRITDVSEKAKFGSSADGFDVDGVVAINQCTSSNTREAVEIVDDIQTADELEIAGLLELYPNPASESATFSFSAQNASAYGLKIVNALGQVVYSTDGRATEGANTIELNLENLSKGLYIVQLVQDGSKQQVNLIKK